MSYKLPDSRKGFLPELGSFETTYLIGPVSKTTKSLSSLKVMKRFRPPQKTENLDAAENLRELADSCLQMTH